MRPRLFVSSSLYEGAICQISVEQRHYLVHVLRRKDGDEVDVFNGKDGLWKGHWRQGSVHLVSLTSTQPLEQMPRRLAYSPIKQQDILVQKAVELGMTHFQPIWCQRTVMRQNKKDRLEKIIIEACEQCQRLDIPVILDPMSLEDFVASLAAHSQNTKPQHPVVVVLEPRAENHIKNVTYIPCWMMVGPEGGWSPSEIDVFKSHPNVAMYHTGPRILRSETAALAAAAWLDWTQVIGDKSVH